MSEDQDKPAEESTDHSRQSTEENVQPVTESQLQTENMEVQHPHHITHKKKWGEYLLEFFMLFLAVFLGFVAENMREHYVENERASQFALSLFSDIQADTSVLNTAIEFGNKKVKAIDSLIEQIEQPRERWKDTLIYMYTGMAARFRPFGNNSGTYEQMKTSGSLRYLKKNLADLLNQYDVQAKKTKVRDDIHLNYTSNLLTPFTLQIIDIRPAIQIQNGAVPTHPLGFRKTDKESIIMWINYVTIVQSIQARSIVEYNTMLDKAKEVLEELKKQYNLR